MKKSINIIKFALKILFVSQLIKIKILKINKI